MNIRLINKRFTVFLASFLCISLLKINARETDLNKINESYEPLSITASFIQNWYCKDWTYDRWIDEINMMKRNGLNEIIIQWTVDTQSKFASYKSSLPEFTNNSVDMLSNVLSAADDLEFKVRIGLGHNDEWWNHTTASNINWLEAEKDINIKILNDINDKYGNHKSLQGWYITYEFSQNTAISKKEQLNINSFLKGIAKESKRITPSKDIMISPFYNSKLSKENDYVEWASMISNILRDSGIDIVALQDSVGVEYNTLPQVKELFNATSEVLKDLDIRFFANIETFAIGDGDYIPSNQSRINNQLMTESPYVESIIGFSINHYQNANESNKRY